MSQIPRKHPAFSLMHCVSNPATPSLFSPHRPFTNDLKSALASNYCELLSPAVYVNVCPVLCVCVCMCACVCVCVCLSVLPTLEEFGCKAPTGPCGQRPGQGLGSCLRDCMYTVRCVCVCVSARAVPAHARPAPHSSCAPSHTCYSRLCVMSRVSLVRLRDVTRLTLVCVCVCV